MGLGTSKNIIIYLWFTLNVMYPNEACYTYQFCEIFSRHCFPPATTKTTTTTMLTTTTTTKEPQYREDFTKLISITSLIWIHDVEGQP